jgi:hypothetical protein
LEPPATLRGFPALFVLASLKGMAGDIVSLTRGLPARQLFTRPAGTAAIYIYLIGAWSAPAHRPTLVAGLLAIRY